MFILEKPTQLTASNVYYWLIYTLFAFLGYLKLESFLKSLTIRKKDAYIKDLHDKLIQAEQKSVTTEEASIIKDMMIDLIKNKEINSIH